MPNNAISRQRRREGRKWVVDPFHVKGGYWYSQLVPAEKHGQWSTYNNWYCRCPLCSESNREKKAAQKLAAQLVEAAARVQKNA